MKKNLIIFMMIFTTFSVFAQEFSQKNILSVQCVQYFI